MKKKQYISPLVEAEMMVSAIGIMKTSITTTPSEPSSAPDRKEPF